jgi:pimeloyl-ACP methyl ester carboxylesterase
MLPTDIQEIWLTVEGLRIHCLTSGKSGPPVLLLHGGGLDSATLSWSDTIVPLAQHYRVFAPDLPGFGLSNIPDIQYTIDFYVDFIKHLLDELHLNKIYLAGLSLGGAIALSFTLRFPEQVEKLVLVDAYGIIDANIWPRWVYLLLYFYVHHLSFLNDLIYRYAGANRERIRKQLVASGVVHRADRLSPQLIEQIYQHAHLPGQGKAFTSFQQNELLWNGLRTSLIDHLHEIAVPTLIINGEQDRGVPLAYAQKAHALISGSQLAVLKDCGHWPQRETPVEFNRILKGFLDA